MEKITYVSIDVETTGPIPGPYSLLSLGAAAFAESDGSLISTFSVNFETLHGAKTDPETMKWWSMKPIEWSRARERPEDPEMALHKFCRWLQQLPGNAICVAQPTTFDFMFLHWYLIFFLGKNPFGFVAVDMQSHIMGALNARQYKTPYQDLPESWTALPDGLFDGLIPHVAVDDAIMQGHCFMQMIRARRAKNGGEYA